MVLHRSSHNLTKLGVFDLFRAFISWPCMDESCNLLIYLRAFIVIALPLEYYLAIKTPLFIACCPLVNVDLWNHPNAFIWVLRIFVSMGAWYGPKLPPSPVYLTGLISALIKVSQKLRPLIVKPGFICAHRMSLCKSCRPLFVLGLCKYSLDSLTHKGSSFFCYIGQLGMTT